MFPYKKSIFYTLEEVLNFYPNYAPSFPHEVRSVSLDTWFTTLLSNSGLKITFNGLKDSGTIIKPADVTKYVNRLMDVVFNRFSKNYIYRVDTYEHDYTFSQDDFRKAINVLLNVLELTAPKYIPILYQYEENYQHVFKQLESESKSLSRYNDTPQGEIDNLDFASEDYATNIGKSMSASKVDSGSVPAKLKELQDNFKSVILNWANEFDQIFVYELQLEGF